MQVKYYPLEGNAASIPVPRAINLEQVLEWFRRDVPMIPFAVLIFVNMKKVVSPTDVSDRDELYLVPKDGADIVLIETGLREHGSWQVVP